MPACTHTHTHTGGLPETHTSRHKCPGHEHQPSTCISAQQQLLTNEEGKHCGAACLGRCEEK